MAVPTWPAALPTRFVRDSLQEGEGDGLLRTPMDAGPGKVRPFFTPTRPVSLEMILTAAQKATLRSFVRTDLAEGAMPFRFPAVGGGTAWLVRLAQNSPSYAPAGGKWRVAIEFEVIG